MATLFGNSTSGQNDDPDTRRDGQSDQASGVTTYSVVNRRGDVQADPPRR